MNGIQKPNIAPRFALGRFLGYSRLNSWIASESQDAYAREEYAYWHYDIDGRRMSDDRFDHVGHPFVIRNLLGQPLKPRKPINNRNEYLPNNPKAAQTGKNAADKASYEIAHRQTLKSYVCATLP